MVCLTLKETESLDVRGRLLLMHRRTSVNLLCCLMFNVYISCVLLRFLFTLIGFIYIYSRV